MRKYILLLLTLTTFSAMAQNYYMLVGTYTGKGSKGIYVYNFNATTGEATLVSSTDTAANPSYLAIAPGGKYVYAVNETGGSQPGGASAYAFDKAKGTLSLINTQPTGGDHPCYVAITKNGKWVTVGNYTGGSVAAFAVQPNGGLVRTQLIQHKGSSANAQRQEKAHVHATVFSPDEQYIFVPDLGMDKVMQYRFTANAKKPLQPANPAYTSVTAGDGPRHFVFGANKKFAYLIEELSGTVAAYSYNKGRLTFLQRISTHPAGYNGAIGSADIHVSPDGNFLYASNRGDANNIAIFSIGANGKLTLKGFQSVMGIKPRNFTIDPSGNFLLVANQDSNSITIFRRNKQTGLLRYTDHKIEVPNPVCLQMMRK